MTSKKYLVCLKEVKQGLKPSLRRLTEIHDQMNDSIINLVRNSMSLSRLVSEPAETHDGLQISVLICAFHLRNRCQ